MNNAVCLVCASAEKLPSPKKDICNECYVKLNKKCNICNQVKKLTDFHVNRGYCKKCYYAKVTEINNKRILRLASEKKNNPSEEIQ